MSIVSRAVDKNMRHHFPTRVFDSEWDSTEQTVLNNHFVAMKVAILLGKPYARPNTYMYINDARRIPSLISATHQAHTHTRTRAKMPCCRADIWAVTSYSIRSYCWNLKTRSAQTRSSWLTNLPSSKSSQGFAMCKLSYRLTRMECVPTGPNFDWYTFHQNCTVEVLKPR